MLKHIIIILTILIFETALAQEETVISLVITSPTQTNPVYVLPGGAATITFNIVVTQLDQLIKIGTEITNAAPPVTPVETIVNPANYTWTPVGGRYQTTMTLVRRAPLTTGTYNLWLGAKQPASGAAWNATTINLGSVIVTTTPPPVLEYSITGNRVLDLVRKPGVFAGVGPTLFLRSNYQVNITFEGFENLKKIDDPTQAIPKYYAFVPTTVTNPNQIVQGDWIAAPDLNTTTIPINATGGIYRNLWEKVEVTDIARAGEYRDPGGATIVLNVQVIKDWIDPGIGGYENEQY